MCVIKENDVSLESRTRSKFALKIVIVYFKKYTELYFRGSKKYYFVIGLSFYDEFLKIWRDFLKKLALLRTISFPAKKRKARECPRKKVSVNL